MREQIAVALQEACTSGDKRRACLLRLINAAIRDRDAASRMAGRDKVPDSDIAGILQLLAEQRERSANDMAEKGRNEDAARERADAATIRFFLPAALPVVEMVEACRQAVSDTGAKGLRDVGRCMSAIKERYHDKVDMVQASGVVRSLLS
ncbi:GatB/YqeY domain-containing protein [Aureimonas sp. AU40]|uniref:GatB/YqeY domain-containing protein n=1 Tax=Aureimonas sp. AU40 TaxID=1637747 RepID=UPI000780B98F|nr:GatB/YqeY domain-containing protein [Aureimonas sp. AU40]